jgi:hypothetical protein
VCDVGAARNKKRPVSNERDPVLVIVGTLAPLTHQPHNLKRFRGSGSNGRWNKFLNPVTRVYLPPDANTLLRVADHCLRSTDYINVIVADKQKHLQFATIDGPRVSRIQLC